MKEAIETLLQKVAELKHKRDLEFNKATQEINSIESSIEQLTGKKVWQLEPEFKYDDESPNYIKGSFEEM